MSLLALPVSMTGFSLVYILVAVAVVAQGQAIPYETSTTSQYIHSNDTIVLTLSSHLSNSLYGQPGSVHALEFIVHNRGSQGHFSFRQHSEDGFTGKLPAELSSGTYLTPGQQQTIRVEGMTVPNRPEGARIRYTLTAFRDSGMRKREAEAPPADYNPTGDNNNGNDGRRGGVGGTGGGRGSSGNSGSRGNSGGFGPNTPDTSHPSFRREVSLTIEFIVASEMDDNKSPWIRETYLAESQEETCREPPSSADCNKWWWVLFKFEDKDSGVHLVDVVPSGEVATGEPIFFRYVNFPLGTDKEQELVAGASCCIEGMMARVTDAAGNQAERLVQVGGTGQPMSDALFYGLIGGGALIVVIIVVFLVVYCCRKRNTHSPVPTNP